MFILNINPVLFHLGPFEIRYYGIIYAFALVIGYFIASHFLIKKKILNEKEFDELFLYIVIAIVVGSRIGSVLSDLSYYAANPLEIFAVWHGGLAFHGSLVAVILVGYWYCRKNKKDFFAIADIIVMPIALGLAFGRIGNFLNGEFYGKITNLPWGVKFPNVEGYRHPVQLYESLKNFFIFGVLWFMKDKNLPKGFMFWSFIFLYGVIRFFLEFYKDLQEFFLGLTWGQFWCIPMILIGGFMLIRLYRKM